MSVVLNFQVRRTISGKCLYILDGELCVSADERIYNMSQGELIFHKPLEFHKFIVNNPKGATVLTFSFSAGGPLNFLASQ